MLKYLFNLKVAMTAVLAFSLLSCDDDDDVKPNLRTKIDYNVLTPETSYSGSFVDENGATTVDFSEGNARYKMFQALNTYAATSISSNSQIEAAQLKNMFSNTSSPFTDASLNASGVQLKNVVASSRPDAEAEVVRAKFESLFDEIEVASNSVNTTASRGQAGKLGSRLVDGKGIELIQVIQKGLIGALQLDYIGNVLLDKGLSADNYSLVAEKPYTPLEHNWDEAYGLLTLNPIYLQGSTDATRGTSEFGAGSYIWEYNKAHYADIYPAFLKGRAAIVNNDRATLEAQATFIRTEFEKALANAALGYLGKWNTGSTDADKAHAIGEALGFIYSLRFATIHGADAAFSDDIIENLVGSAGGYWDIDGLKTNAASEAIKAKFNL
jgi:hypothetical protein